MTLSQTFYHVMKCVTKIWIEFETKYNIPATEHWASLVVKIEFEFYIGNDNTCQTKILKNNNIISFYGIECFMFRIKVPSLGVEVFNVLLLLESLDESIFYIFSCSLESSTNEIMSMSGKRIPFIALWASIKVVNESTDRNDTIWFSYSLIFCLHPKKKKFKTTITIADSFSLSLSYESGTLKIWSNWQAQHKHTFSFQYMIVCQNDVLIHCHSNMYYNQRFGSFSFEFKKYKPFLFE